MIAPFDALLFLPSAYLLGSIPFGLCLGLWVKGLDIREHGSGNIGATNALRILGRRLGALVLLLDITKGALPTALFPLLASQENELLGVCVGLATILGHVFPITLRFKGGKGVATAAGVFLVLHPPVFGTALACFLVVLLFGRMVSLASLCAAASLPAAVFLFDGSSMALKEHLPRTLFFVLTSLVVFLRHRGNMRRILEGTEPRLGENPQTSPTPSSSSEDSEKRGVA